MPFLYEVTLEPSEAAYILKQHLVESGTLVGSGQAIAILTDGAADFHLTAPKQGLLVAWFAASGSPITSDEAIARIVCEGAETAVPASIPQRIA
jgi:biotin carboxyl carrier protein